jgi:probable rRNA maturation factor
MEISILYEDGIQEGVPSEAWLRSVVETVLMAEGSSPASEVGLVIAGQDKVHELNRTYLDEDHPTDVLSFPMIPPDGGQPFVSPPDGIQHLGEVILSLPQAVSQAREHGHSTEREIAILVIHGVLHLLGYDHAEPDQERGMRGREAEMLRLLEGSTENPRL